VKETFAHPGRTWSTLTAIFIIAGIKGHYSKACKSKYGPFQVYDLLNANPKF